MSNRSLDPIFPAGIEAPKSAHWAAWNSGSGRPRRRKLELLLAVRSEQRVTWSGAHRPPLPGLGVYPRARQDPLPVWIAVGGTPESVVRAGVLGLPLAVREALGQQRPLLQMDVGGVPHRDLMRSIDVVGAGPAG